MGVPKIHLGRNHLGSFRLIWVVFNTQMNPTQMIMPQSDRKLNMSYQAPLGFVLISSSAPRPLVLILLSEVEQ